MASGNAQQITQSSKSNLAFAFLGLPADRKYDLQVFYAFCRVVDDLADDIGPSPEEKYAGLNRWRLLLAEHEDITSENELEEEVLRLIHRHDIDLNAMIGIVDGCATDVSPLPCRTFDDLLGYTYKVASCVGIVSATLFGASPDARAYAIALGHALQITNILRDVGEDWEKEKRIYLPEEDILNFGYSAEELAKSVHNQSFVDLMNAEAKKADAFYQEATEHYAALSPADKKALAPAEAMHAIYENILKNMIHDDFHVFEHRYKLSKWKKLSHLFRAWWRVKGKKS